MVFCAAQAGLSFLHEAALKGQAAVVDALLRGGASVKAVTTTPPLLAVAGSYASYGPTVAVHDPATGYRAREMMHNSSITVWSLAALGSSGLFATVSSDGDLRVWDALSGDLLQEEQAANGQVFSVVVVAALEAPAEGWLLATGHDKADGNEVRLWRVDLSAEDEATEAPGAVGAAEAAAEEKEKEVEETDSDYSEATIKAGLRVKIVDVGFLSGHTNAAASGRQVGVWALSPVRSADTSAPGMLPLLASGSSDKTIRLWRLDPAVALDPALGSSTAISAAAGDASAAGAGSICIFSGFLDSVWAVADLGSGMVAGGSADGSIRVFSADTLSCLQVLEGAHSGRSIYAMRSLGEGRLISCGAESMARVWAWDASAGVLVSAGVVNTHHSKDIASVSVTAGGLVLTGSYDCTLEMNALPWATAAVPGGGGRAMGGSAGTVYSNALVSSDSPQDLLGGRRLLPTMRASLHRRNRVLALSSLRPARYLPSDFISHLPRRAARQVPPRCSAGSTPLHLAAASGSPEAVAAVLKAGADASVKNAVRARSAADADNSTRFWPCPS